MGRHGFRSGARNFQRASEGGLHRGVPEGTRRGWRGEGRHGVRSSRIVQALRRREGSARRGAARILRRRALRKRNNARDDALGDRREGQSGRRSARDAIARLGREGNHRVLSAPGVERSPRSRGPHPREEVSADCPHRRAVVDSRCTSTSPAGGTRADSPTTPATRPRASVSATSRRASRAE